MDASAQNNIKEPNVAGQFYPGSPGELKAFIAEAMDKAQNHPLNQPVDVLVVPHAGYIFSGWTAAYGYKAIKKQPIKTVIMLGPTHYYRFPGIAIWPAGQFQTPFGMVDVDEDLAQELLNRNDDVRDMSYVFDQDHVLEVELPFLQELFDDIKIVPMIMSRDASSQTVKQLADDLNEIVGDRKDVLLLISSDQSHFHTDREARQIDKRGLDAVVRGDVQGIWQGQKNKSMEIDGYKEIITAILYAQQRGAKEIKLLHYSTSGDVTGDRSRVVGYAALIMHR